MLMDPSAIADKRSCYDAHLFLEPAVHDVICCVDGRVAKDAVRSRGCGHIFGMQCILEYLVNHEVCPKCGVPLDCTMLEPSEVIRGFIMKAPIRCPTGVHNCEWQGPLHEMMSHLHSDRCGVPRVVCPFCKFSFEADDFDQHKQECPDALVMCPYCDEAIERRLMVEHKQDCEGANRIKETAKKPIASKKEETAPTRGRLGTSTTTTTGNRRTVTTPRRASLSAAAAEEETRKASATKKTTSSLMSSSAARPASSSVAKRRTSVIESSHQKEEEVSASSTKRPQSSSAIVGRPPPGYIPSGSQHQQQSHDLSLRSPTKRLMDDSTFYTANNLSGIHQPHHHHQVHGVSNKNFPPTSLSPSQLGSWRTMTTSSVGSAGQQNNSQLLVSYQQDRNSGSSQQLALNNQQGGTDFSTVAALVQELSRVGQKCHDLESEVDELKKANAAKDSQISILTMQMKKLEEQVASIMGNNRVVSHDDNATLDPTTSAAIKKQLQTSKTRPVSPPEKASRSSAAAARRPSSVAVSEKKPPSPATEQLQYKMKNKNYKPTTSVSNSASVRSSSESKRRRRIGTVDDDRDSGSERGAGDPREKVRIPKDVVKDVKRTYDADDLMALMKRQQSTSSMASSGRRK